MQKYSQEALPSLVSGSSQHTVGSAQLSKSLDAPSIYGPSQRTPGGEKPQYLPEQASTPTNGESVQSRQGIVGYHPQATRPSALSPRRNGRPASAPHYPRDDSDVPEPPFVPAEDYQVQIHQTAAYAMNSGDWQNLMVNSDGSYQKHEPWSQSWIKSRGYIRAWLEFQAQADEDLRLVKEMPGVRQHTHHNEIAVTQHKNVPVSCIARLA